MNVLTIQNIVFGEAVQIESANPSANRGIPHAPVRFTNSAPSDIGRGLVSRVGRLRIPKPLTRLPHLRRGAGIAVIQCDNRTP